MKHRRDNAFAISVTAVILAVFGLTIVKSAIQHYVPRFTLDAPRDERILNDMIVKRSILLYPSQLFNRLMGADYYPDCDTVIRNDGYCLPYSESSEDISYARSQISALNDYCTENGKNFLYVILPAKPEYDSDVSEYGVDCHRNETADRLSSELHDGGIPVLNLRDAFRSTEDYYSYFYKTDHHWTADAGLMAAQRMTSYLDSMFSIGLDTSRIQTDLMERTVLPSSWIGETGRKTRGIFGETDDLVIVKPSYTSSLQMYNAEHFETREGDFDIFLYEWVLNQENPHLYGRTLYNYYMGDNSSPITITNNGVSDGNILIVKDSFINVVAPFVALTSNQLTLWDMRSDTGLIDYLDSHPDIDTVIVAYSIDFSASHEMNQFFP